MMMKECDLTVRMLVCLTFTVNVASTSYTNLCCATTQGRILSEAEADSTLQPGAGYASANLRVLWCMCQSHRKDLQTR